MNRNVDEDAANERWIEDKFEAFEQALQEGNRSLAEAIKDDTKDEGFTIAAQSMESKLADYDLTNG